ncbi:hypothetical protein VKT23_009902 [Stygiomarasmius scandens]|uniref:HNH nuclease domain-containing protein n=1 Tax=Marasmiellus scandens TaxID=2682957 RepID=A0ABR1JEH7_9AGAR
MPRRTAQPSSKSNPPRHKTATATSHQKGTPSPEPRPLTPSEIVIQPTDVLLVVYQVDGKRVILVLPVTFMKDICMRPLRMMVFACECITSRRGFLSTSPDAETCEKLSLDGAIQGGSIYYFHPDVPIRLQATIDSELANPRTKAGDHCTLADNDRANFSRIVRARDNSKCVFTRGMFYQPHHVTPHAISEAWMASSIEGERHDTLEPLRNHNDYNIIDSLPNGISVSSNIHGLITEGNAAILCIPPHHSILRLEDIPAPKLQGRFSWLEDTHAKPEDGLRPVYVLHYFFQGEALTEREFFGMAPQNCRAFFSEEVNVADLPYPPVVNYNWGALLMRKYMDAENSLSSAASDEIFAEQRRMSESDRTDNIRQQEREFDEELGITTVVDDDNDMDYVGSEDNDDESSDESDIDTEEEDDIVIEIE